MTVEEFESYRSSLGPLLTRIPHRESYEREWWKLYAKELPDIAHQFQIIVYTVNLGENDFYVEAVIEELEMYIEKDASRHVPFVQAFIRLGLNYVQKAM